MSEEALYDELFKLDHSLEKKLSNGNGADYLNNLFNEPPPSVAKPKQTKKQTFEHQYLKLAQEPSNKVQKKLVQLKEEKFLTKDQIRHRRNVQQLQQDLMKTKKEVKKYGPTIIDIFASEKDQQKKPTLPPTKPKQIIKDRHVDSKIPLKKPILKTDKVQKKQQKQQKIMLKNQRKAEKKQRKSSSSESSSGSSSDSSSQPEQDWRNELRQLTGYNPSDQKYKKRDRQQIQEAGAQQLFRQDERSRKIGRRQQELDFMRQQAQKAKKHKRN